MAQTATSFASVMKDAWTSDRIIKQFEGENAPLGKIEKFDGTMIGTQAQVPIQTGRAAGYTSQGASGGLLNPATNQPVAQATFTLVYNWFQIGLEASALVQAGSNVQAIVAAKDLELEGAIENTRHQITRQAATNGDGIVAACASGGASTTVSLLPAASEGSAYGYSALARGWVDVGSLIDIGTTADTDSLVAKTTVTAVNKSTTAPTITIGSSITTTAGTHFVYIANPAAAHTAANSEVNGLRQIVNSTGAFGGLNPATAGQEYWQAAQRDTTTTVLSLDLILGMQRAIMQNSNKGGQAIWTGYKQRANFYSLLQNQVRFSSDSGLKAGDVESVSWNGMKVDAFADFLDTDLFILTLSDLCKVTGSFDGPKWASDLQGSTAGQLWSQGTTGFVDALCYPIQIAAQRRNTHAAATALQ